MSINTGSQFSQVLAYWLVTQSEDCPEYWPIRPQLSCPLLLQVCASHLSWHVTSVRVTISNSLTKTYFLRAGDRSSDQAQDWNVIINTRVMIVWGLIESDYISPSPRVGRLWRILASDWPEPPSPDFWLADNMTARCDSGQGQLPVIASLLPALSEPMRAQYWGHVTCADQWEAEITLYCADTRKQRQVWGRWGLIPSEKIYNLPFLLWEEGAFRSCLKKFFWEVPFTKLLFNNSIFVVVGKFRFSQHNTDRAIFLFN